MIMLWGVEYGELVGGCVCKSDMLMFLVVFVRCGYDSYWKEMQIYLDCGHIR